MATDPRTIYLNLRGRVYWLKLPIPRGIRSLYPTQDREGNATGKHRTHIEVSLKTGDINRANRAKHAHVAKWHAEFVKKEREAAGQLPADIQEAHEYRDALRNEQDDDAAQVIESVAIDRAEEIEATAGYERAKQWHALATQVDRPSLREAFDKWLDASNRKDGTKVQYRHAFKELLQYLKVGDALPDLVTRVKAQQYVEWLNTSAKSARGGPLAYETKQIRVVALSSFWTHLERNEWVPQGANPWRGHEITGKKEAHVHPDDVKRPYTLEELRKLIDGPDLAGSHKVHYPKRTLMELYALGLYTGARLNELCSLTLGDVERTKSGYVLHIRKAKTSSGRRSLPIVRPIPVAVLRDRIGKRKDSKAQLFAEFMPGGHDKKLSFYAQKALGRYRDRLGFGTEVDFHSCRRNFASTMEALAAYPPALTRWMGHKPPGITLGLYAKGEAPLSCRSQRQSATRGRSKPRSARRWTSE